MTFRPFLVVLVAVASLAGALPLGVATHGDGTPDSPHEQIEFLCQSADPAVILAAAAPAPLGLAPVALRSPPLADAVADLYDAVGIAAPESLVADVDARAGALSPAARAAVATLVAALADAERLNALAMGAWGEADYADAVAYLDDGVLDESEAAALPPHMLGVQAAAASLLWAASQAAAPVVEAAAAAGGWPRSAPLVADPVGLIWLGSTGDDEDTLDRVLVVDAGGNDVYRGRIGGAAPPVVVYGGGPAGVGLAVDLAGDDELRPIMYREYFGGGAFAGVGVYWDAAGTDTYAPLDTDGLGAGEFGVGLFVEDEGSDDYPVFAHSLGYAINGVGIAIEATGDDDYSDQYGGTFGINNGSAGALGLACEMDGADEYRSMSSEHFGRSHSARSRGWFGDFGRDADVYAAPFTPAADNTYWTQLTGQDVGYGLDQ